MAAPLSRLPAPAIRLLLPVKRAGRRVARSALMRSARVKPKAGEQPGRKVYILLVSAWGMGGTIRAAINLAGYLTDHHEVEIISTYRRRERPYFPFADGVKLTALDDERPGATPRLLRPLRALLRRIPSALYEQTDIRRENHSLWTDVRLVWILRRRRGVVIATRPGLNLLIADLAIPGLVTIGIEQMNLRSHARKLRKRMLKRYHKLDGLAVLTDQDMEEYRAGLNGRAPRMWRIPNTVSGIEPPQADPTAKRIFAAGRHTKQKGFDFLIPAFAPVAAAYPDWELKICGRGEVTAILRDLIAEHGLEDRVILAGPTEDVPGEMAQASIYALSSRFEGFPLVLIEAMSKAMAVVAFDCPTGPRDIIDDHRNGLLVTPPRDVEALSAALLEMVGDEELRRRSGAAAVETAADYTMAAIGPKWDEMLQELVREKG